VTSNHQPSTTAGGLSSGLTISECLDAFDAEGRLLLKTIDGRRIEEKIPFCPGWTVRDLLTHLGYIYRWAAAIVAERRADRPSPEESRRFQDPDPADGDAVISRLNAAHRAMVEVLRQSTPSLKCWTTWATPSAYSFWIRRMLHETLIHRVDIQNAGQLTAAAGNGLNTRLAADGIDEMMCGFAQRYSKTLRANDPGTLVLVASDLGQRWWARIGPDAPEFGRGPSPPSTDTEVHGRSGELLLLLWNRRNADGLTVRGRRDLLDTWAREAHL
jgi:uncharacterized protein (TIGR03083 family)